MITAAPAIPTDATYDVEFKDQDGFSLKDVTGIADNSNVRTNLITDRIYACQTIEVEIDFATNLSGNTAEFDITLLYTKPLGI